MQATPRTCPNMGSGFIPRDLVQDLKIDVQKVYHSPQTIALIAREVQNRTHRSFCLLPFCHTTEAAAMGADIHPADDTAGPRAGRLVLTDLKELNLVKLWDAPPIKNLISACASLSQSGNRVVYEICGPVSILSCMMDLSVLFRQWAKEQALALHVFRLFKNMLLDYLREISRIGVHCVSYADPAGNPNILGPRYSKWLTEQFMLPFLNGAVSICEEFSVNLLLCPLTASALREYRVLTHVQQHKNGQISICCVNSAKKITPKTHVLVESAITPAWKRDIK